MSNISAPFAGDKTELHITASIGGTIDATTKVGDVTDISAPELTRNIIEYMVYGEDYKKRLGGKKDASNPTFTLAWNPGDADHTALKARYDDGADQTFAIRWVSGAENATMEFTGIVESYSIGTPQEDVVPVVVAMAVTGAPSLSTVTA